MSANIDAEIGTKIHTAMWRAKKSQTQVARAIGLDQPAISKRLRGFTAWKATELLVIADFLGVPLSDIQLSLEEFRALTLAEAQAEMVSAKASGGGTSISDVGHAGPLTRADGQSDNACIRTSPCVLTRRAIHVSNPQVTALKSNGHAA